MLDRSNADGCVLLLERSSLGVFRYFDRAVVVQVGVFLLLGRGSDGIFSCLTIVVAVVVLVGVFRGM